MGIGVAVGSGITVGLAVAGGAAAKAEAVGAGSPTALARGKRDTLLWQESAVALTQPAFPCPVSTRIHRSSAS